MCLCVCCCDGRLSRSLVYFNIISYIIYFFIFFTETKEEEEIEVEVEENEKSREERLLICPDQCLLVIIFKHTQK